MPFPYNQVFTNFGVIARYCLRAAAGSYGNMQATQLPTDLQAIISTFGTGASTFSVAGLPIEGLDRDYQGFQTSITGWKKKLQQYAANVLQDRDSVIANLSQPLTAFDLNTLLAAIIQQMADDNQTVKSCNVTLGSVVAGAGNVGNGTALPDKVLDGYSRPLTNKGFAHVQYMGRNSELAVPSETMQLVCVQDSFTGGAQEGSERWTWVGGQQWPDWDWHPEGSGIGPGLTTANADTTVRNFSFEQWSGGVPVGWTAASGANLISQEKVNVFRGASALKITGDGTTGTVQLTVPMPVSRLNARRRYLCTIQIARGGVTPTSGAVTVELTGIGVGSQAITVAASAITTSYATYKFFINLPAVIPANLGLAITVSGTLTANSIVYLDSGSFAAVPYFGGINCNVIAGSVPWTKGDRLSFTVANDLAGNFNAFARRAWGCQLPSTAGSTQGPLLLLPFLLMSSTLSNTINDALAA